MGIAWENLFLRCRDLFFYMETGCSPRELQRSLLPKGTWYKLYGYNFINELTHGIQELLNAVRHKCVCAIIGLQTVLQKVPDFEPNA